MNAEDYQVNEVLPTPAEFCELRKAAGLTPRRLESATIGLQNSIMGVSIRKNNQLVGMARLIGDGATFFEIVDVAVLPAEQHQGLGTKLMQHIQAYLQTHVPTDATVTLIADVPADRLYEKFDFQPTMPESIGMVWRGEKKKL
ncbi:GNAT family N-acetyltransferase [Secundilactobacillus hailunensis]|uniref:GNAT family N-acetyltransferase n=1 Tax=Secundilactobacillus hailunensis TaxID=2559923 RepID=A0ABW1TAH9_9LACO|nr:GNAT family N-acetyltransferase [Secundilactobacillus hailunensis]